MLSSFRRATVLILAVTSAYGFTDQLPLKYSALFGDGALITAVAVDSNGNAYITGTTGSALPVTPGAFQTLYNPATCTLQDGRVTVPCPVAFAAKLSADGTTLLYLTYLGMSFSRAFGISVDAQGNAWIAGSAASSDLPVTSGALQTTPGASFVVKLNASGSQALLATYFGADVTSQALDANGNLYLAGYATAPGLPVTAGAFQTDPGQSLTGGNGIQVPFVSKLDPTGKLVYATFSTAAAETPPTSLPLRPIPPEARTSRAGTPAPPCPLPPARSRRAPAAIRDLPPNSTPPDRS